MTSNANQPNRLSDLPLIVYNPYGHPDPSLAQAAEKAGAVGAIDLTLLTPAERERVLPHAGAVRVDPAEVPPLPSNVRAVVLTGASAEAIAGVKAQGRKAIAECRNQGEIEAAKAAGADMLLVRGREAAGPAGEEPALTLLQHACARTDLPVLVQGGLGPRMSAAAFAMGARAVVLDAHVWFADESPLAPAIKAFLVGVEPSDTRLLGGWRVHARRSTRIVKELAALEDASAIDARIRDLAPRGLREPDPREQVIFLGEDASLARGLKARHGTALASLLRGFAQEARAIGEAPAVELKDLPEAPTKDFYLSVHASGGLAEGLHRGETRFALAQASAVLLEDVAGHLADRASRGDLPAGISLLVDGLPDVTVATACADLRERVTIGTRTSPEAEPAARTAPARESPTETEPLGTSVAVVGIGCVFPEALTKEAFWDLLTSARSAITEVPPERWDPALFWDPDPKAPDKTYSKIGAFIRGFEFDSMRFRIPPKASRSIDAVQQWALTAAADALADAGYSAGGEVANPAGSREPDRQVGWNREEQGRSAAAEPPSGDGGAKRPSATSARTFDRTKCAVILGNSIGGENQQSSARRVYWVQAAEKIADTEAFRALPPDVQQRMLQDAETAFKSKLPPITEDSMPGELSNVIAGRIANALNLGGKNFTTDAACASSLAALDAAMKALASGEFDTVLCGGADRSMDPTAYVKFSKIGALSAAGSFPFDARANGFVMGEGCGILVLKRLTDAMRDDDKIYAVIRSVGASSDGKGKGITAPNPEGQKLAVRRALDAGKLAPRHVQLVEAHGTSTAVGDVVEVESLQDVFGPLPEKIALGSVKSQIGHLKSAAGAAGLIKAALALHHRVIPPSASFETPNPRINWSEVQFYVPTKAEAWPAPPGGEPRRAAISSFGFGGTNFHAILEEFMPEYHGRLLQSAPEATTAAPRQEEEKEGVSSHARPIRASAPPSPALPEGILVFRGRSEEEVAELAARTHEDLAKGRVPYEALAGAPIGTGSVRLAVASTGSEAAAKLEAVAKLARDPKMRAALPMKGAHLGTGKPGKVAFVFPGQGSQYVNMLRDLAGAHGVVRDTFEEADRVLKPLLDGRKLTDLIFVPSDDPEAVKRAEAALRETEVCQPAMLAADVALHRLLLELGVKPDAVAGHSLGEYAALVAAGVLSFPEALHAVSARGKEMAHVHVPDMGRMASVGAPAEAVEPLLAQVPGYVVAANKNGPRQTVIAGETAAVEKAGRLLAEKGFDVIPLNVSAAFHTEIVAPASKPLKRVLSKLEIRPPRIPVIANVTGEIYPANPEEIVDLLARQVAAPVEWQKSMERLHAEGFNVFVEVGPKRALAGLVSTILPGKALPVVTNHPKKGGLPTFREALAQLAAAGVLPLPESSNSTTGDPEKKQPKIRTSDPTPTRVSLSPESSGVQTPPAPSDYRAFEARARPAVERFLQEVYAETGADRTLAERVRALGLNLDDVVVSGAAIGLPGRARRVFDDANFERLFRGENAIDRLTPEDEAGFLERRITRLVKDGGEPRFERIDEAAQVIKLAARRGGFDLAREYGLDEKFASSLDTSFRLAIAAGIDALRDAGIPLVREERVVSNGRRLPGRWMLPEALRDETGVVFASAFPGLDNLVGEVSAFLAHKYRNATLQDLMAFYRTLAGEVKDDAVRAELDEWIAGHAGLLAEPGKRYEFNRKFLFNVLSLGHAEFAEFLGIRGPNTQVNAACASTTQAVALAEDWIRTGRCKRVVVIGADDATSENLLPWIGSGFLASGAATTAPTVEEGALPFDRRRHGMIIGMGAVGLVVEAKSEADARGMVPVAKLIASRVANSAFHGSRLDVEHIAGVVNGLVEDVAARTGVKPADMARDLVFVSHETYTPARGGSASAEVNALRRAFGPHARDVLVVNTKGFTGHPMGAGIEDAVAVKCLQYGKAPPVANFREPDPELGELNLSKGGTHARRFALRLAAGFGSQIALLAFEKAADGDARIVDAPRHQAWLDRMAGLAGAELEVANRTLRVKEAARTVIPETTAPVTLTPQAPPQPTRKPASAPAVDLAAIREKVVGVLAEKTGYPPEALDPTLDLEADLGIDTVKQAEIFALLREEYGFEREEGMKLKDYPTIEKVAGYIGRRLSAPAPVPGGGPASPAGEVDTVEAPARPPPVEQRTPAPSAASPEEVLSKVRAIVAEKTGYPEEMLDPTLDLEADLGIDTVKQAEVFGEVREHFGIPRLEGLKIKDYPTLEKVAAFAAEHLSAGAEETETVEPVPSAAETPAAVEASNPVRRLVPRDVPAPLPGTPREFQGRAVGVLGPGAGEVASAFREAGVEAREVQEPAEAAGLDAVVVLDPPTAREFFRLAKALETRFDGEGFTLLAAARDGDPVERAGVAGALKALAREFPRARFVHVDLESFDAEAIAEELLRGPDGQVEVKRRGSERYLVQTLPAAAVAGTTPLPAEGHFVVTGGAQGITAEVLRTLAQPGVKLTILARTALDGDVDELAALTDAAIDAKRPEVMEALKAKGERATPVAVERVLSPLRKRARTARGLKALLEEGSGVHYASCDVTDRDALSRALAGARERFGPVTGVIHAAGIEESKRFTDKDLDAFDRTWGPKVEGARHLDALTRDDPLAFFVTFGSVAGRFGNATQVDYSAANCALSALARAQRDRGLSAACVGWTAWGETGMATRGSTLTVLQAVGVEPLSTREGVEAFAREMSRLDEAEVVIAKALGALDEAAPTTADAPRFFDRVTEFVPGRRTVAERALTRDEPFLHDHEVDGVPYLPGVVGLEAFAECADPLAPRGLRVVAFEDVRWEYPVKLLKDEVTLRVEADLVEASPEGARVDLALVTDAPGPRGPEPRVHFRATAILAAAPPRMEAPEAEGEPWSLPREAIYATYFHGESFQVIEAGTRLGLDAVAASGRSPAKAWSTREVPEAASPLAIEAALQAAGLWALAVRSRAALPHSARRVSLPPPGTSPESLTYLALNAREEQGLLAFDVHGVTGAGEAVLTLEGLSLIPTGESTLAGEPFPCKRREVGGVQVASVPVAWVAERLGSDDLLQLLSTEEREAFAKLAVPKRRSEWLAGTLAAKAALRDRETGPWTAICIERAENGAPIVHGSPLAVTISHAGAWAAAAAFDPARERVGFDLERVEPRSGSWEEEAFTPSERERLPGEASARAEAATRAWCAKEAIVKALGVGLNVDLHDLDVHFTSSGASVDLKGEAKAHAVASGARGLHVWTGAFSADHAAAVAVLRLRDGAASND